MLKMIKLVLKCLCMSMLKPSLINAREIESDIHELRDGMCFKMLTCNVVALMFSAHLQSSAKEDQRTKFVYHKNMK